CRDRHAIRCPTTVRGSESRKKFCVITRYLRDEYNASNSHRRIGVGLEGGIPEILRVALEAGKEPDARRTWIRCKSQREGELDRRAVRALALALELVQLIISDAGRAKSICVRGTTPFKHQHRKPLPARKPIAVKGAEREMPGQMRGNLRRISYGQELNVGARELAKLILRSPRSRMSISCADDKSKPPIKIRPRVEIAHCMNYMIKSAWHSVTALKSAFGHERTLQALVDHLVSARNECGGYGQTERLRGSEIDDHLKYGWLLNRQVSRLGAGKLDLFEERFGEGIGRIGQSGHAACRWQQLPDEFDAFAGQLGGYASDAGDISARTRKARDQPGANRISCVCHDDRDLARRLLCRLGGGREPSDDHIDFEMNQLGG